jgi:hypothetical protein
LPRIAKLKSKLLRLLGCTDLPPSSIFELAPLVEKFHLFYSISVDLNKLKNDFNSMLVNDEKAMKYQMQEI